MQSLGITNSHTTYSPLTIPTCSLRACSGSSSPIAVAVGSHLGHCEMRSANHPHLGLRVGLGLGAGEGAGSVQGACRERAGSVQGACRAGARRVQGGCRAGGPRARVVHGRAIGPSAHDLAVVRREVVAPLERDGAIAAAAAPGEGEG